MNSILELRKKDSSFYSYNEMADLLIPYLWKMRLTHPITYYPNDLS